MGVTYIPRDATQASLGHQRGHHTSIEVGHVLNFLLVPSLNIQCTYSFLSCLVLRKSRLGGVTGLPMATDKDGGARDSSHRTSALFPLG